MDTITKWIIFLTLFLFINTFLFANSYSDQVNLKKSPKNILAFADYLFKQKDYYRAIVEYKRFIFMSMLSQKEEKIFQAKFKIGLCYQRIKKYKSALTHFKKLKEEFPKKSESIEFEIARTYYLKKDYQNALEKFQNLLDSKELSSFSQYMIGWCYLKQMDWQKAEVAFKKIEAEKIDPQIYSFSKDLVRYSKQGARLPHKSPFIASMLSTLIPGSGQIYLHRFADGFFSMALILTTALLGNHYYQKGYKVTGSIFAGLSAIFYTGNIYGAAASAKLINASIRSSYLEKIEKIASERKIIIEVWH
jgi:tetratricopeptide (TPR) repeat protein